MKKTNSPSMNPERLAIGRRIRRERLLWDMTQEELSSILGVSANYLGQIERGNRELSRNMEERICRCFHLSPDSFRRRDESAQSVQVSENGVIFHDLSEEEIARLLHSCTPSELQLCGHLIRSTLLFLRNPTSPGKLSSPPPEPIRYPAPEGK